MDFIFNFLETTMFTKLFGSVTLYALIAGTLKFIFVLIVLMFIYKIVTMITMDIKSAYHRAPAKAVYLKLLNDPRAFDFPIRDEYYLTDNTTIGRADDNAIVIKDRQMSKHQAHIIQNGGRYFIDDMGATNPTCVNDHPIEQPTELFPRDVISVGGIDFAFVNGGEDVR